jgi:hypothetical protein
MRWFALFPLLLFACGTAKTEAFRALCDTRMTWPASEACTKCVTAVKMPDCNCYEHPRLGACFETFGGVSRDCSDESTRCALACAGNCGCLDDCYAKDATCADAARVHEACIVDTCGAYCK